MRAKTENADVGFKEKWSEDKIQKEILADVKTSAGKLIEKEQCFALEINSNMREALELKYWYGKFTQGRRNFLKSLPFVQA